MKLLPLAVLLPLLAFAVACNDDSDERLRDAQTRAVEVSEDIRNRAENLADQIDERTDASTRLADIGSDIKTAWNENCRQLAEAESDADVKARLTDICGDLRNAIESNDDELLQSVRDRLSDLTN